MARSPEQLAQSRFREVVARNPDAAALASIAVPLQRRRPTSAPTDFRVQDKKWPKWAQSGVTMQPLGTDRGGSIAKQLVATATRKLFFLRQGESGPADVLAREYDRHQRRLRDERAEVKRRDAATKAAAAPGGGGYDPSRPRPASAYARLMTERVNAYCAPLGAIPEGREVKPPPRRPASATPFLVVTPAAGEAARPLLFTAPAGASVALGALAVAMHAQRPHLCVLLEAGGSDLGLDAATEAFGHGPNGRGNEPAPIARLRRAAASLARRCASASERVGEALGAALLGLDPPLRETLLMGAEALGERGLTDFLGLQLRLLAIKQRGSVATTATKRGRPASAPPSRARSAGASRAGVAPATETPGADPLAAGGDAGGNSGRNADSTVAGEAVAPLAVGDALTPSPGADADARTSG